MSEGTAAAMNTFASGKCSESMMPPKIGPTIDQMRPIPSAHPTPVERI